MLPPSQDEPIKDHAICMCCLKRTHPTDEPPTIVLGSPATYGVIHECQKCGTICTLPGCYGRPTRPAWAQAMIDNPEIRF